MKLRRTIEFQKRTIAPGWTEVRMVMQRPDSPDYSLQGDAARMGIARFILAFAAGLAQSEGNPPLAKQLRALWERVNRRVEQVQ